MVGGEAGKKNPTWLARDFGFHFVGNGDSLRAFTKLP